MRLLAAVTSLVLSGCMSDVVLGRFLLAPADDGGSSADGGFTDAGRTDAGLFDGGNDGGALTVDLRLSFSGPAVQESGATASWALDLRNVGAAPALGVTVTVVRPANFTLMGANPCVASAGDLSCDFGTLAPGASASTSIDVLASGERGWSDLKAVLTTASSDVDLTDNTVLVPVALTEPGIAAIPVVPQTLDVDGCRGTNLRSFAACVMGSTQVERYTLFDDAGLTDDAGFDGLWSQSAHHRNLAFRFVDSSTGQVQGGFVGGSVSATCFEGVIDLNGVPYVGAWRACVP